MANWKGIIGRGFRPQEFKDYVGTLSFSDWRPQFVVVHNTSEPRLSQWHSTAGEIRMRNLADYYKGQGWSAGPHLFVADDLIWVFTPLTTSGVHSPSWNGVSWGIEMVGEYEEEPFNPGVRENTVDALAVLHTWRGIDPQTLRFHKEDPKTTHKECPGKNVDKADLIQRVAARMASGNEGEHMPGDNYLTLGAAIAGGQSGGSPSGASPASGSSDAYVTAYNYEDNLPAFTDYVARGRHKGGGGAPADDFRADIGRNDFANPSSLAIGPEANIAYGSRVFIQDYGWFLAEDQTASGLSHAPRFDIWTSGATQAELAKLTGSRAVTVFPPGSIISQEWRQKSASPSWDWQTWTSKSRLTSLKKAAGSSWHGFYVEGILVT